MQQTRFVARKSSYEEFLEVYVPSLAVEHRADGRTLLFDSVANRDVSARVAITMRLLDDGADASVSDGGINVLHVLFGRKGHNGGLEAPMLRRLIEGGADVNLVSKRWGPPLVLVMANGPWPESEMVPFYEAFFDYSGLDLSVPSTHTGKTLAEYILASLQFPILQEFVATRERSVDGVD